MKTPSLFVVALFIGWLLPLTTTGQVKIGYSNMELILAFMPESKSMEQQLQTYQKKLWDQLQTKESYGKVKFQEYQELAQKRDQGLPFDRNKLEALENELKQLELDLSQATIEAEQSLMRKRQEFLDPILTKLQNAIDAEAKAGGYTLILNQTTSAGVSTILYGPKEDDITKGVFRRLNIPIPNE